MLHHMNWNFSKSSCCKNTYLSLKLLPQANLSLLLFYSRDVQRVGRGDTMVCNAYVGAPPLSLMLVAISSNITILDVYNPGINVNLGEELQRELDISTT